LKEEARRYDTTRWEATPRKFLKILALIGGVSSVDLLGPFKKMGFGKEGGTTSNERRSVQMSELSQLGRTYSFIMKRMMETGQAPFYTDIAAELGVSVEEGRKALHALFGKGTAVWVFPNTSYIASFTPFSNLPTQYRITIEEQQKWFGV
jgi:hypothetical protein